MCKSFANNEQCELEIVFPSEKYVETSVLEEDGGDLIVLQSKMLRAIEFPREGLRNIEPPRKYPQINRHLVLSSIVIAHSNYMVDDNTVIYFGNQGFSPTAWGEIKTAVEEIFIGNWEIGVLFLPKVGTQNMKRDIIEKLPFDFPAPKYPENDKVWIK